MAADPLTVALRTIVAEVLRDELREALAMVSRERLPALLTTEQVARELGVSTGTIRRLRQEGLPTVMVGESPRFQLDTVLSWFAARGGACALRSVR